VNARKSVNVAIGLTVGAATSTSTFLGQGHIELTRDAGNAFIDFKDAFADDYDARIIASSNQLQFFSGGNGQAVTALTTGTGKVGIATDTLPSVSKLEIHSDKLGGVAGPTGAGYTGGNSQELLLLKSPDVSNSTTYRFTTYRHTSGTSHTSSEGRLRRQVDVTDMGFIGFGDGYVNVGYGTESKMQVSHQGYVTKSNQPSFLVLPANNGETSDGVVTYTSVVHNTGGHYSTSTGKFTAPTFGYYSFFANYTGGATATSCQVIFQINGTINAVGNHYSGGSGTSWNSTSSPYGNPYMSCDLSGTHVYLSANDYVQLKLVGNNGPGNGQAAYMRFFGYMLH